MEFRKMLKTLYAEQKRGVYFLNYQLPESQNELKITTIFLVSFYYTLKTTSL